MRFAIRTDAAEGVRVIKDIPDVPLCRIEGRNGIGKSLAIRLLQLATGDQPYAGLPAAWESLRAHLRAVHIQATSLRGAGSIAWDLKPEEWPPEAEPVGDWLGTITIDDRPATLQDAQQLLRVYRVAGDEDIQESIARRIREDLEVVRRTNVSAKRVIERLDAPLSHVASVLNVAEPAKLVESLGQIQTAQRVLEEMSARVTELEAHRTRLGEAVAYRDALKKLEHEAPVLQQRIDELTTRIRELDRELTRLGRERDQMQAVEAAREAGLHAAIQNAEAQLVEAGKKLEKASEGVQDAARRANLPPSASDVRGARVSLEQEQSTLRSLRLRLDMVPRVQKLLSYIESELQSFVAGGLADEPVAILEGNYELTAVALLTGVQSAQSRLAARPRHPRAEELDEQIAASESRLALVRKLETAIQRRDRQARSVQMARQSINQATEQLADLATPEYGQITGQIAESQSAFIEARVERAETMRRLEGLTDGHSEAVLRRRLAQALASLGMEADALDKEIRNTEAAHGDAIVRAREAESHVEAIQERLEQLRVATIRAQEALTQDGRLRWVALAIPAVSPPDHSGPDATAGHLERLAHAVESARHQVDGARTDLLALQGSLESLADSLERNTAPQSIQKYIPALRRLYEQEFETRLSTREISEALFDNGSDIRLDLERRIVDWTAPEGDRRSRPLEAFSSGERVFTYTLALLGLVETRRAENRLVAIDEFGAYVARDRLGRLLEFIRTSVLGRAADQVLVILPLAQEYAVLAQQARGTLREQYARRAEQIRQRGYFAEQFDSIQ